MKEYKFNSNNNFIEGYYLSNLSICDDLIDLFKESDNKMLGRNGGYVNKKNKDSLDLPLDINDIAKYPVLDNYFKQLATIINCYKKKYIYCDKSIGKWSLENNFIIQKYKPTQGYHVFHCEKASINSSKRHLVWMTYLNDVKQGGETEWYYQKLKVRPEKGLTVIWSADWTFTHKGHTTIDEDKYIITGWFEFKK